MVGRGAQIAVRPGLVVVTPESRSSKLRLQHLDDMYPALTPWRERSGPHAGLAQGLARVSRLKPSSWQPLRPAPPMPPAAPHAVPPLLGGPGLRRPARTGQV